MTEASISGQYNDVLSRNLTSHAKRKLATEKSIAIKVFKYLISFDYNCRKSKTYHKLLYICRELSYHCPISLDTVKKS